MSMGKARQFESGFRSIGAAGSHLVRTPYARGDSGGRSTERQKVDTGVD